MDNTRNYILTRLKSRRTSIDEFNFDSLVASLQSIDKFSPYITSKDKVGWIGYLKMTNRLKDTDLFIRETKSLLSDIVSHLSSM